MNSFLEECKENCREYNSLWPQRLARVVAAFVITAIVAPVCYLTDSLLGKTATLFVGLILAGTLVAIYWALASWWFRDREAERDQYAASFPPPAGNANPFLTAPQTLAPPAKLPQLVPLHPVSQPSYAPQVGRPLPAQGAAKSGAGVGTVLAVVFGGLAAVVLLCTGTVAVALFSLGSAPGKPARPNRVPLAGPNHDPFANMPHRMHDMPGDPFANMPPHPDPFANMPPLSDPFRASDFTPPSVPASAIPTEPKSDPFAAARERHQKSMDEMQRRHDEIRAKIQRDQERFNERRKEKFGP